MFPFRSSRFPLPARRTLRPRPPITNPQRLNPQLPHPWQRLLFLNRLGGTGTAVPCQRLFFPYPLLHGLHCAGCHRKHIKASRAQTLTKISLSPIIRASVVVLCFYRPFLPSVFSFLFVSTPFFFSLALKPTTAGARSAFSSVLSLKLRDSFSCPLVLSCLRFTNEFLSVGGPGLFGCLLPSRTLLIFYFRIANQAAILFCATNTGFF